MVLKAKSDTPIKLIKNNQSFSSWHAPVLDKGNAPAFNQPVDDDEKESEVEIEDAQEMISAEELQSIRDAAYQEGFDSGRQEGLLSGKKQVDQQIETLTHLIKQLADPVAHCETRTQEEILTLAFAVARQIVRRELQQDPTQIIAIIREALKKLPVGAQNIRIALHPEDAKIVRNTLSINEGADNHVESSDDSLNESKASDNKSRGWELLSDPSIERGGCQVNTENSKIDASIDKQVAMLFSRVAGGQRAGEQDAE